MLKNHWLKLSLFSLIAIVGIQLLQIVFSSAFPPSVGFIGNAAGPGMGRGVMNSSIGISQGGMGTLQLVSLFNIMFTLPIILGIVTLFVGIIGFLYSYVKQQVLTKTETK